MVEGSVSSWQLAHQTFSTSSSTEPPIMFSVDDNVHRHGSCDKATYMAAPPLTGRM